MTLIEAVLGAFTALFGAGWLGTYVKARAERKERRDSAVAQDIRAAQDALQALRRGARLRARKSSEAPDDDAFADLADNVDTAANRTLCATVVSRARAYIDVSESYASGDPATGVGAEREAYNLLADALREELERR